MVDQTVAAIEVAAVVVAAAAVVGAVEAVDAGVHVDVEARDEIDICIGIATHKLESMSNKR